MSAARMSTSDRLAYVAKELAAKPTPPPQDLERLADALLFGVGPQPPQQPWCNRFLLAPGRQATIERTERPAGLEASLHGPLAQPGAGVGGTPYPPRGRVRNLSLIHISEPTRPY